METQKRWVDKKESYAKWLYKKREAYVDNQHKV